MSQRKKVFDETHDTLSYELEGTIDAAIETLQKLKEKYGTNAVIKYQQRKYEEGYEHRVFLERDETDQEMKDRIEQEEYQRTLQEGYQRRQYEELRKKFEGT